MEQDEEDIYMEECIETDDLHLMLLQHHPSLTKLQQSLKKFTNFAVNNISTNYFEHIHLGLHNYEDIIETPMEMSSFHEDYLPNKGLNNNVIFK